jgi:hypothetical protein
LGTSGAVIARRLAYLVFKTNLKMMEVGL